MRKKKWATPYIENHSDFVFTDAMDRKGKWHDYFGKNVIHLEIGCGKGAYLEKMSLMNPGEAWIGLEKDSSCIATAARMMLEKPDADLSNKVLILANGEDILDWFDEAEISIIHLNFSDPWPKKHNHKRRLSASSFIDKYKHILVNDGLVIMKTDNSSLFEDAVINFLDKGFHFEDFSVDYRRIEHDEDAISEYEERFISENKPIYRFVARKINESIIQLDHD